jgi:hypothetical protein
MQVNEHAGQVQQGRRLLDSSRSFDDTRGKPEMRAKRLSADEPRRQAARGPSGRLVRYGAGF